MTARTERLAPRVTKASVARPVRKAHKASRVLRASRETLARLAHKARLDLSDRKAKA